MPHGAHGRILLADDEPLYLRTTAELLRRAGFDCRTAVNAEGAMRLLSQDPFDLMIVDLNMPGNLDLELLNSGRRDYPDVPMIVVTGAPSLRSAIDSVRLRIADYLLKPVKFEELVSSVRRALAGRVTGGRDLPSRQSQIAEGIPWVKDGVLIEQRLLGDSPPLRDLLDLVRRTAPSDASVLITGESGTGKELVAQALHRASNRKSAPFVTIDCTAIPESLFESVLFGHAKGAFTGALADQPGLLKGAAGGTVFLDEIGELPLSSQSKLLRLIQHSTFTPVGQATPVSIDVRFVAATNRDLEDEVRRERFRRDLFYRLAVVPIVVPPLRDRDDDVILLARHFLQLFQSARGGVASGFSPEAIAYLRNYPWPGNIRELRNVVERAVTLARSPMIERDDLPAALIQATGDSPRLDSSGYLLSSRTRTLDQADRGYLMELLRTSGGNITQAAAAAGVTRQGLYKLLQKHGITPAEFRP